MQDDDPTQIFRKAIPKKIAELYDFRVQDIEWKRDRHPEFYEINSTYGKFVLRATSPIHRSCSLLESEADWILFLALHGIPAAKPIRSHGGKYVELIEVCDISRNLMLFEKAPGSRPTDWTCQLIERCGELLGKMHSVTAKYEPICSLIKRPQWHEKTVYNEINEAIKEKVFDDPEILRKFDATMKFIQALPKNSETYGLIHSDFHARNFFVENEQITLFDFDDWFVSDIATSIFFSIQYPVDMRSWIIPATTENLIKRRGLVEMFVKHFLIGYRRIRSLGTECPKLIIEFIKLKTIISYIAFMIDPGYSIVLRQGEIDLSSLREQVASDISYLDIDITKLL